MAIGKPGSYATVEPALVDFGAMAERNIDKIKADEAAKAKAKADAEAAERKAIADRGKDLKLPNPLEVTTLSGADMKYGDLAQGLFNDMTYAKMLYEKTGSAEAKQNFETLNYAYGQLANNVTSLKGAVPKFTDPTFLKGKNLGIAQERAEYLQKLNEEGKMRVDGRNILVKKPDGGEFRLESFVPSMMNIPEEYDYQKYIKSVKDTTNASVSSGGSYYMNYTRENILDPASESQREYILNAVNIESRKDAALIDYAISNGLKDEYGLTKTSGFTDEERQEWANQTYKDIINSFPSKDNKKYSAPPSGGKDDEEVIIGNVVGIGENVEKVVKEVATKLKGVPIYTTKDKKGVPVAGVLVSHIYSTGGKDPKFYFQTTDPTTTSYGGSGGKTPGYQWVTPQTPNYSAYVNDAIKVLNAKDAPGLSKKLRGESQEINTSGY
jgi:hypothetical protein